MIEQTQPNLSNVSDEQLNSAIEQLKSAVPNMYLQTKTDEINNKSPLNLIDRAILSFGDETGKINYLRKKFTFVDKDESGNILVGNSPSSLMLIDPAGTIGDFFGDIADLTSLIPPIAGQIMGALAGSASGPAGTIGGGALGAGAGESLSKGIGKTLGVNEQTAEEMATDVVISSSFGAAGEGLGAALKGAGNFVIKPFATKALDKAIRSSENPSQSLSILAKLFRFTSAVDEKDVIDAGLYGFNKTLNPKYSSESYLDEIVSNFARGVIKHNDDLGSAVSKANEWAINNFGNKRLEIRVLSNELLNILSGKDIGIVSPGGTLRRAAFNEPSDFRIFEQMTDLFFAKNPRTGQLLPKNLTLSEALAYKKRVSTQLNNYFASGRRNPKVERSLAEYFSKLNSKVEEATVTKGIPNAVENNPYIKANRAFSSWKSDIDLLKNNGLDISDISELKKFFRGDKIVLSKLVGFAKGIQKRTSASQTAFEIVAKQIPVKFNGGGIGGVLGDLYDELRKFNAAQGFKRSSPNMLRFQTIASMIGFSQLTQDMPGGKLGGAALGTLFATPAGARIMLKAGEKALRPISQISGKRVRIPKGSSRTNISVLSQLLASNDKKPNNKNRK